jgi:hypothetical protein
MATQVEICNEALTHIGAKNLITSISEQSKEASRLNAVWNRARDNVLQRHRWNFAKKQVALAIVSGVEVSGWDYVYAYPTDCVTPRELWQEDVTGDPIAFASAISADSDARYVLTNQESAELIYTARITQIATYSPPFCTVLAWELADMVCMPLTADLELKKWANTQARATLIQAATQDANEQVRDIKHDADWIKARA